MPRSWQAQVSLRSASHLRSARTSQCWNKLSPAPKGGFGRQGLRLGPEAFVSAASPGGLVSELAIASPAQRLRPTPYPPRFERPMTCPGRLAVASDATSRGLLAAVPVDAARVDAPAVFARTGRARSPERNKAAGPPNQASGIRGAYGSLSIWIRTALAVSAGFIAPIPFLQKVAGQDSHWLSRSSEARPRAHGPIPKPTATSRARIRRAWAHALPPPNFLGSPMLIHRALAAFCPGAGFTEVLEAAALPGLADRSEQPGRATVNEWPLPPRCPRPVSCAGLCPAVKRRSRLA